MEGRKRQKGGDTNVDGLRASREGMEIRCGCFVLGDGGSEWDCLLWGAY